MSIAVAAAVRPPRTVAAPIPSERLHAGTLIVVLAAIFMAALDFFIVNVAIPSTSHDLHAGAASIQWIVAGYGLAYGVGLITGGRLGDLLGRRRVFVAGMALFTLASAACGAAPSAGLLIAGRALQGVAAALMTPQVLAILGTVYTGEARAKAINAYGMTMGLAAVFGQLIGGVLIHADIAGLGWRACFIINVPVGIAALAAVPRYVPDVRPLPGTRLDLRGAALVTLALVATILPLIEGRAHGWPLWTWLSFATALALFAALAGHQRRLAARGGSPLVDPALFRERAFTAGLVAQTVFWMGQASFFLVFALYVQDGRGLDALHAGLIFLPLGAGYMATSLTARHLAARLGRQVIAVGTLVMAVGEALLGLTVAHIGMHGDVALLTPALVLDAAGMGMAVAPLASTILARVAPEHAGAASGVLATAQQVGNAIGVAVIGIVFYGALHAGSYPHAFETSLAFLGAVALAVAAAIQLVPKRA